MSRGLTRRKDNERRTRARHTVTTYPAVAAQTASTSSSRAAPDWGCVLLPLSVPLGRRGIIAAQTNFISCIIPHTASYHNARIITKAKRTVASHEGPATLSVNTCFLHHQDEDEQRKFWQVDPCPVQHRPGIKVAITVLQARTRSVMTPTVMSSPSGSSLSWILLEELEKLPRNGSIWRQLWRSSRLGAPTVIFIADGAGVINSSVTHT